MFNHFLLQYMTIKNTELKVQYICIQCCITGILGLFAWSVVSKRKPIANNVVYSSSMVWYIAHKDVGRGREDWCQKLEHIVEYYRNKEEKAKVVFFNVFCLCGASQHFLFHFISYKQRIMRNLQTFTKLSYSQSYPLLY